MTAAEVAMERWCDSLWQTHGRRQREPSRLVYFWPTVGTIKQSWPLLADHLIDALAQHLSASRDEKTYLWAHWAFIDPPPVERKPWRVIYAVELLLFPAIALDLAHENPLGAVFKRARLTPEEKDVARPWFHGSMVRTIASDLGRREATILVVIARIEDKLVRLKEVPPRNASRQTRPPLGLRVGRSDDGPGGTAARSPRGARGIQPGIFRTLQAGQGDGGGRGKRMAG